MFHVLDEANRCIQCPKPLCRQGCPIKTPIPQFIKLFREGQILEAGRMNLLNNPLSIVCSMVCPHERFCEGHCILGKKSTPIQISSIENYIAEYNQDNLDLVSTGEYEGRIAIIGGGPAGIAMSVFLAVRGYRVAIYEAKEKIGGILRYGIPEFRLPNRTVERIEQKLLELGVVIHPNTLVGPVMSVSDLFRDGFDAVFMSTGVWKPKKMGIKGESLPHVHYAIDYLKSPGAYRLGSRVLVIGAGNTAMDAARTAIRSGSRDVSIVYYKGEDSMSATQTEIEYTRIDGVQFAFWRDTAEITDDGLLCRDTNPESGTDQLALIPADSIIIAVSQGPQSNVVSSGPDIRLDEGGRVITDGVGLTTMPGVFASGDVVTGAKTVVEAVRAAKITSNALHNYVQARQDPNWIDEELWPDDCLDTDFEKYYPASELNSLLTEKMRSQRPPAARKG